MARRLLLLAFVAFGIVLLLNVVWTQSRAGAPKVKVIGPDSLAYGRSYAEWSAAWQQWNQSMPSARHPLFDNADCSAGQSGPVWFLGGRICANGEVCTHTNVVRNCTVPADKALYVAVLNMEDSALEERLAEHPHDPAYQQIATLRSRVNGYMSDATVMCAVDGVPVPQLQEKYRVQSGAFGFTLPADNMFNVVYGVRFPEGSYFPAVDEGWYVMLAPLPKGRHVIAFRGVSAGNTEEAKYNLDVR